MDRLTFAIPCATMVFSYVLIWLFIWSNGKYLKKFGHDDIRGKILKREILVIKTISFVCLCYILFVTSNLFCPQMFGTWFGVCDIIRCLYYFQYSLNFFIYAASNDQYRKAYLFFLKRMNPMEKYNSMYIVW